MSRRQLSRSAIVAMTTSVVLAGLALPALAVDEGADPGPGLGTGLTLLIFLGIPLAVFLVVALLVYGPGQLGRPRYRPGRTDWSYPAVWVGGPADPDAALTQVLPDDVIGVRGGGAGAGW